MINYFILSFMKLINFTRNSFRTINRTLSPNCRFYYQGTGAFLFFNRHKRSKDRTHTEREIDHSPVASERHLKIEKRTPQGLRWLTKKNSKVSRLSPKTRHCEIRGGSSDYLSTVGVDCPYGKFTGTF